MKRAIAALALAVLFTTPAAASVRDAAFSSTADRQSPQTSIFAGATYSISLDRGGRPNGRASLNLSGMMTSDKREFRIGQGLEITGAPGGKPSLLIAGRETKDLGPRTNLSTGATVGLAVLGLIVVAGGVAALLIDERSDREHAGE